MSTSSTASQETWEHVETLLMADDAAGLNAYFQELAPGEVARMMAHLDVEERARVFGLLEPELAADLIEALSDVQGAGLLEALPAERAAAIVDVMESGERVDVLGELGQASTEAILAHMDPEEADEARQLLTYEWDTAGGLMITEYLAYGEHQHVDDVLQDLRTHRDAYADYPVQYVYVVSETGVLAGVVRLRDLVLAPGRTPLAEIMIRNPVRVPLDTPLDELSQFFDRHAFFGVPAVDAQGTLVGVVQREDVEEALGERADETFLRASGIVGGEELRTMPLGSRCVRRLAWLIPNIFLNLAAVSVLMHYEATLDRVVALAIFLPILSDMCGNSGSQAAAVSIREMALGIVKPRDLWTVLWKETQVGVVTGIVQGVILGLVAGVYTGNPWFVVILCAAMVLNTLVSVACGGLIPLGIQAMRKDPALASGPILTTVTDMCGFFILMFIATWALTAGWIAATG